MERITGTVDLEGLKRLQMPGTVVVVACPKCGDEMDIELIDQLQYPADPEEEHGVTFECETCEHEVERRIRIVSVIATMEVEVAKVV